MPPIRRLSNVLGGWAFSWAVGRPIPDNQSGYRLVCRRIMEATLASDEPGFAFEVEMITTCIRHGRHDRLGPDPDDLRRCAVAHPPARPPPELHPHRPPGPPRRPAPAVLRGDGVVGHDAQLAAALLEHDLEVLVIPVAKPASLNAR